MELCKEEMFDSKAAGMSSAKRCKGPKWGDMDAGERHTFAYFFTCDVRMVNDSELLAEHSLVHS